MRHTPFRKAAAAVALILVSAGCSSGEDSGESQVRTRDKTSAMADGIQDASADAQPTNQANAARALRSAPVSSAIRTTECPATDQISRIVGATVTPREAFPIDLSSLGSSNYAQPCTWYSDMSDGLPEVSVVFSVYPAEYPHMGDTLPEARSVTAQYVEQVPGMELFDAPEFGRDAFGESYFVAATATDPGVDQCSYYVLSAAKDVMSVSVSNQSADTTGDTCDQAAKVVELLF